MTKPLAPTATVVAAFHLGSASAAIAVADLLGFPVGDKLAANIVFFLCLASLLFLLRGDGKSYKLRYMLGFMAFALAATAIVVAGFAMLDSHRALAMAALRVMSNLGFYPLHADAWLPATAIFWTLAMLPLSLAALGVSRVAQAVLDDKGGSSA